MMKATYGTGCFALVNTGETPVVSSHRLLTTIAYRIDGETHLCARRLDLRRRRGGAMAARRARRDPRRRGIRRARRRRRSGASVYLVPAFVGLGAPYWDPECRGALFGLTRATGPKEIARAALESVGYQTLDLIEAMRADLPAGAGAETVLRVDGGMAASDWTMQRLADILDAPVDRPAIKETTALGAAYLAGLHAGFYPPLAEFARALAPRARLPAERSPRTRARKWSPAGATRWARTLSGYGSPGGGASGID